MENADCSIHPIDIYELGTHTLFGFTQEGDPNQEQVQATLEITKGSKKPKIFTVGSFTTKRGGLISG